MPATQPSLDIAAELNKASLGPGSKVAVSGTYAYDAYWARAARVKIVAQIPECTRSSTIDLQAVRSLGVFAIVGNRIPDQAGGLEWKLLGDTARNDRYVMRLLR